MIIIGKKEKTETVDWVSRHQKKICWSFPRSSEMDAPLGPSALLSPHVCRLVRSSLAVLIHTESWNVLTSYLLLVHRIFPSLFATLRVTIDLIVECFSLQVYLVENVQDGLDSALKVSQTDA